MIYYDFVVGDTTYKLRLTTRSIMNLEKKIGMNPLMIFGASGDNVPTVSVMLQILYNALEPLNHGIGESEACSIFDKWLADGHTITDFIPVILEVYKVSGLLKANNENEENPKN